MALLCFDCDADTLCYVSAAGKGDTGCFEDGANSVGSARLQNFTRLKSLNSVRSDTGAFRQLPDAETCSSSFDTTAPTSALRWTVISRGDHRPAGLTSWQACCIWLQCGVAKKIIASSGEAG